MTDAEVWTAEFAALETIGQWNLNVIGWMKERGDEYKRFAHSEAKRRGYEFNREHMEYRCHFKMYATRGRNLIAVGWQDGILRCVFASKEDKRIYRYGSAEHPVPKEEYEKLLNVPFPDKLFVTNIKGKFPTEREAPLLAQA